METEMEASYLSTPKMTDPIRRVFRECLSNSRKNIKGRRKAYRIANKILGAKSSGKGVPPTGVGKGILSHSVVS
jgi:hypothetical protein